MEYLNVKDGVLYAGENPILLRGMGLGGWLLPEGYMWKFYTKCDRPRRIEALIRELCGPEYAQDFWKRYYDAYITEADIAWMAGQGMNSLRLPLNARTLFHVSGEEVRFNPSVLQYVDNCLRWCRKYGLYLILDMHAAPGGQTGQNIDDSAADLPELYMDPSNQDLLVRMWHLLAARYAGEPAIGGYDLLNEPLPKWNSQYYPRVLPLYRRLIRAIRKVDKRHLLILEGVHWATDFHIFDDLSPEEAADNVVLEFHKYWSDPDEESLAPFLEAGKRLRVPLWMGEGGENNCPWYTTVFPLYERLGIGWSFWTYKKMETPNSPATFRKPEGWEDILAYLDGGPGPEPQEAAAIFDRFLDSISQTEYHTDIVDALLRRPGVRIPAGAFDAERIRGTRTQGAAFRNTSRATLLFADGHTGPADWCRYGGEPQPESQRMLLRLQPGDAVGYRVCSVGQSTLTVTFQGRPGGTLRICGQSLPMNTPCPIPAPQDLLWLECPDEEVFLESLLIEKKQQ